MDVKIILKIHKVSEHILLDFSMLTILSLESIENKHDVYRCKDYIKDFVNSYENAQ